MVVPAAWIRHLDAAMGRSVCGELLRKGERADRHAAGEPHVWVMEFRVFVATKSDIGRFHGYNFVVRVRFPNVVIQYSSRQACTRWKVKWPFQPQHGVSSL